MTPQEAPAANATSDSLIQGRIRPPLVEGWVPRPRVERLLADLISRHRAVIVSATAGAGKTTLVAAVAQALERPLGWLTLDWTDASPGRLVTYLEAALARAVPSVRGVARDALAARLPHPEAVGLLVEAAGGSSGLLVIDEVERLSDTAEAWAVIEALLRHAPADLSIVLCSRRPIPGSVLPRRPEDVASIGDQALALTVDEAASVLADLGRPTADAAAVLQATGGWMTGVLFEAWRFGEDVAGGGGASDPLHGYLSAQILSDLPAEDRDFLIAASLLGEITAARAAALGLHDAASRLASLRSAHIPASWSEGGRALRCHARFREYLQDCLANWDPDRIGALRLAHGTLLSDESLFEEATEVLLAAGKPAAALEPAGRAIFDVMTRLDFAVAQRWLDALAEVEPEGVSPFVLARLMLALATEDHRSGIELVGRLSARGKLIEVVSSSSVAAMMVGQCLLMGGRYDDAFEVFAKAPHDADFEILRAYVGIYMLEPMPPLPEPTGGPFDGVLLAIAYGMGRLAEVLESLEGTGWRQAFAQPWLIAALSDAGRVREAVELYEAVRASGFTDTSLEAVAAPRVLTDAGRREDALAAIARGRRRARQRTAVIYELLAYVEEARLALRLDRDPVAAREALDAVERHPMMHRIGFLGPQVDTWYGLALLFAGRDAEALQRLRRSVASERRTGRMLEMPTSAVYLAEAEWRMGNEEEADRAADLALEAARFQGSNHMLLKALADFPAVLSRRLDAEPLADSPWHELGRALVAQGVGVRAPVTASVELLEFGRLAISVDGEEVRMRIAKSYELLAYLLTRPERRAGREELLDALFDGRADDSTRAYLRQAVRWLRTVLPHDDALTADKGEVRLAAELGVTSESIQVEAGLAQAARLQGAERISATLSALEILDRGQYLPTVASLWVEERRRRLDELATDGRYEAAELAFSAGRLDEAERLAAAVLQAEPFHEGAWRLTMRLASSRGDEHGVLRTYQRCEQILTSVGAAPSPTTRQLLKQLRR